MKELKLLPISLLALVAPALIWAESVFVQSDAPADESEVRAAVAAMVDDFPNNRTVQPFAPDMRRYDR